MTATKTATVRDGKSDGDVAGGTVDGETSAGVDSNLDFIGAASVTTLGVGARLRNRRAAGAAKPAGAGLGDVVGVAQTRERSN